MPQSSITSKSFAKLNLFLEVVRRRNDGYHEIRTIFTPIGLHDTIVLKKTPGGISLSCDDPRIPLDGTNLAHKAAEKFLDKTGITEGIDIAIKKEIPVAAGLGGGSSNAAVILTGMNSLFGSPLKNNDLFIIASEIGADVPFFIDSKAVYAEGIGDVFISSVELPELHFVLVNPGFEVSASWAYNNLSSYSKHGTETARDALKSLHTPAAVAADLTNSLEKPVIKKHPIISSIKNRLNDYGSIGSLMSGSGPTVFGIYGKQYDAASAAKKLKAVMPDFIILLTNNKI